MQLPLDLMNKMGPLLDPPPYRVSAPMTLLIARHCSGLGDWIMTLSVIKILNNQFPNIRVDVDMAHAPPNYADMLATWDVIAAPMTNPNPHDYDYYSGHLIYPNPRVVKTHFITGMCAVLKRRTGLPIQAPGNYPIAAYKGPVAKPIGLPREFITCVSAGMGAHSIRPEHKEWPLQYLHEIANVAHKRLPLVQLGLPGHRTLQGADLVLQNLNLTELCSVLQQAQLAIAIENGVSHIAGHVGTRCVTLYRAGAGAQEVHVGYPKQSPVILKERDAADINDTATSMYANIVEDIMAVVLAQPNPCAIDEEMTSLVEVI